MKINTIFVLFFKEQENFIKELHVSLNIVYDKEVLAMLNINNAPPPPLIPTLHIKKLKK